MKSTLNPVVSTRTSANATTDASPQINGIDVAALRGTIDLVGKHKAAAATSWRVTSEWRGGTRSDHHVEGCRIGGEFHARPFTLSVDEPHALCGTNQFANPQEYLLAGLNACMMVGYVAIAALMNIRLTKLEVEVAGDIDLRGFLAVDSNVKNGYEHLKQTVRIAGDATPEQFAQLHAAVKATSPNFFNITTAVPVNSTMEVIDE